jgi:glutathione S-transferase
LEGAVSNLKATLGIVDKLMEGRLYLAGDDISLVDIWWAIGIFSLLSIEPEWLSGFRNLRGWWERIESRPAWKATLKAIDGHWLTASENK